MYRSFTADEFKEHCILPLDYEISGFISYGAWDDEKHIRELEKALNTLGIKYKINTLEYKFLQHIREIEIKGKKYWFTIEYGGATLSEYLHLACLFGSKKNIHIGSCGGLNPNLNSLDLIVPEYTHGNESTTRIYAREVKDNKHYSIESISQELIRNTPKNLKIDTGPIIGCQAMMGETLEDVKSWSKEGYSGVEMETAVFFAVSNHFKVPCAALVYISDNLIKGQTVKDESHKIQKAQREEVKAEVYKVAIKTILNI
jgi:purine-nucleoside phosphorylase